MLKSKLNTSVKKEFANYLAYNTILGKPATAQADGKVGHFMENQSMQRIRNRNNGFVSSLN